jgi:hypothetical protein
MEGLGPSWTGELRARFRTQGREHLQSKTTLGGALSVLESKVIGRCGPRHPRQLRHPQAPAGAGTLADDPRWSFHFIPTACSWLNAVEVSSPS